MTRPRVPSEIVIEVTGQCRLNCAYCTSPETRAAHVPLAGITKTLHEAKALKIPTVRFTGGEPLLYPHLRPALTLARRLGFYIIINTSAEELTASEIRTLSTKVDCALVSLQGYDQRSSKAYTRSKADFSQKLKNIFALKSLLPALRLGTVITPALGAMFPRFAALATKIAPVSWGLFRPMNNISNIRHMNRAFYRRLILNIIKLRKKGLNVQIANAIPMCVSGNIKAGKECVPGSILDDGHLRIVRDAGGFFKPSYFINNNLGTTIRAAWAHPLLKELDATDHLPGVCQKCGLINTCLGGSRAMALLSGGSFKALDPLFNPSISPCC